MRADDWKKELACLSYCFKFQNIDVHSGLSRHPCSLCYVVAHMAPQPSRDALIMIVLSGKEGEKGIPCIHGADLSTIGGKTVPWREL